MGLSSYITRTYFIGTSFFIAGVQNWQNTWSSFEMCSTYVKYVSLAFFGLDLRTPVGLAK